MGEARPHPEKVPVDPHQEEGLGANQAQVHRYLLQVRSRSLPDPGGQDGLHGSPQEGQGEAGRRPLRLIGERSRIVVHEKSMRTSRIVIYGLIWLKECYEFCVGIFTEINARII